MTVSTAIEISLRLFRGDRIKGIDPMVPLMPSMALHAEKWLSNIQQGIVGGTMRAVTVSAVFGHISMFINERALHFHVTAGAGRFDRSLAQHPLGAAAVGFVAVGTVHFVFIDQMMRRLGKLTADRLVAGVTGFGHVMSGQFLIDPQMELMAVEAADLITVMGTTAPHRQIRR